MIEEKNDKEDKGVKVYKDEKNKLQLLLRDNRVHDYFKDKSVNNSTLNSVFTPKWAEWVRSNPDIENAEARHFKIGSAIDCLLTDPLRFNDEFYIFSESKPSGYMGKFIDELPQYWELLSVDEQEKAYQVSYKKCGYKINIKSVIKSFLETPNYQAYFRAKQLAGTKKVISTDEMDEVQNCVNCISSVTIIKDYFQVLSNGDDNISKYNQVDIYFEYNGIYAKALLDGLIIDHKNKKILPFDLKSTAKASTDFIGSYYMFGYYRQFAFYYLAIKNSKEFQKFFDEGYEIGTDRLKVLPDGTYEHHLTLFTAIVSPKKDPNDTALLYHFGPESINRGINGGKVFINGEEKTLKGVKELIETYKWHAANNFWETTKEIYENNYSKFIN